MPRRKFVFRYLSLFLLIIIATMYKNYGVSDCFSYSLRGPLAQDSYELISYIRSQVLKRPSRKEYNLLGTNNAALQDIEKSERFYLKHIRRLFQNKTRGFFVEAGALDGETMSLSLWLEKEMGWNGLLVEPDEVSFWHLSRKNRKAWSANVCLSPKPYPAQFNFLEMDNPRSTNIGYFGMKSRAMNKLLQYDESHDPSQHWTSHVQCFPLTSLLLAVNVEVVDLLILDVEGAEKDILQNFDFDIFSVQVIFLEQKLFSGQSLVEFLKSKNYVLVETYDEDSVFVKAGSEYEKLLYET